MFNRKGIFMPVLVILTVSIFTNMLFTLGDARGEELTVGTPVEGIMGSYVNGEIKYYNYENIVKYSLSNMLSENFPEKFEQHELDRREIEDGVLIPEDLDVLLITKIKTEISLYEDPKSVNIINDVLVVEFNEVRYFNEFLNGNFTYVIDPMVKVDLKKIKERIEQS